ncbi:hypothetical protein [Sporisorium scitamineum]|uniref:Uncharacterized protein n=1 Tax=Sporisorium scitamineum TaxID=49012 RepID=A0A0F7SC66_9BASI|nr:hypothetical protein [Sporisorium scitamineum]
MLGPTAIVGDYKSSQTAVFQHRMDDHRHVDRRFISVFSNRCIWIDIQPFRQPAQHQIRAEQAQAAVPLY